MCSIFDHYQCELSNTSSTVVYCEVDAKHKVCRDVNTATNWVIVCLFQLFIWFRLLLYLLQIQVNLSGCYSITFSGCIWRSSHSISLHTLWCCQIVGCCLPILWHKIQLFVMFSSFCQKPCHLWKVLVKLFDVILCFFLNLYSENWII